MPCLFVYKKLKESENNEWCYFFKFKI
jgi:hypothetical protein